MKRQALQNKQVIVLRLAFWARNVLGTFEKRAPERESNTDICDAGAVLYQKFVFIKLVDKGRITTVKYRRS